MSYRKKHDPPKTMPERQEAEPKVEYKIPGTARTLCTNRLTVCELPYQRPVFEKDVNHLIHKWSACALEPVVVSFRDGKFYVIDGQHRIAAMKKMNGGKDVMVPCIIHHNMTYEDEAALCHELDLSNKRMSLGRSTYVHMESGKGVEALEIQRLIVVAGFTWALEKKTGKEYEIIATRAVFNAYRLLGGEEFTRMLWLLDETWHGDPNSLTAAMLSGMALFLKTYGVQMSNHAFIKRLSVVDPEEIARRAKVDFSTSSVALRCARILLAKYNGKHSRNKLPYSFNG